MVKIPDEVHRIYAVVRYDNDDEAAQAALAQVELDKLKLVADYFRGQAADGVEWPCDIIAPWET